MIKIVFGMGAILGPKFDRNLKNTAQKIIEKLSIKKNYIFGAIWRFGLENHRNLSHFGIILGPRWHEFSLFFWASVFGCTFKHF